MTPGVPSELDNLTDETVTMMLAILNKTYLYIDLINVNRTLKNLTGPLLVFFFTYILKE